MSKKIIRKKNFQIKKDKVKIEHAVGVLKIAGAKRLACSNLTDQSSFVWDAEQEMCCFK